MAKNHQTRDFKDQQTMENQTKKKRNKPLIIALIGAGALAAGVGGVFATNSITINNGGTIEFGQGLSSTNTCDTDITTSIDQAYNGTTNQFDASQVVVGGIKDYTCNGKTFHVSLLDSSGNVVCSMDGTGSAQFSVVDGGTSGVNDDIQQTVTVTSNCDASTIAKVAITTS